MSVRIPRELLEKLLPLLSSLCESEIDSEGAMEISKLLESEPSAPWAYVCYTQIHVLLRTFGEEQRLGSLETDTQESLKELLEIIRDYTPESEKQRPAAIPLQISELSPMEETSEPSSPFTHIPNPFPHKWIYGIGGALLGILLFVVIVVANFDHEKDTVTLVEQTSKKDIPSTEVARLKSADKCVWKDSRAFPLNTPFASGDRLQLLEGVAKFHFKKGATVVVESPAEFEIVNENAISLITGTVAINAEGPVKDFLVISPDARIVDLGTSFGVHREEGTSTEVEVFQGAVEIRSQDGKEKRGVLRMGNKVQLVKEGNTTKITEMPIMLQTYDDGSEIDKTRFATILKTLWTDMHDPGSQNASDTSEANGRIVAEFNEAPIDGTIDTFNRASTGNGWRTPWFGSGNVIGDLHEDRCLAEDGNKYMSFRFSNSCYRTIAREYGPRNDFDPSKPHVISWRWRFEGSLDAFAERYHDRIAFYANPYFRRLSYFENTWFIGVVGGASVRKPNYETQAMEWFVFDGTRGNTFTNENLIKTGLKLKADTVYRFTVIVYPEEAKYDVAIQTDEANFKTEGVAFRNKESAFKAHVIHFGIRTWAYTLDSGFSLDSLCIQSLKNFNQTQ